MCHGHSYLCVEAGRRTRQRGNQSGVWSGPFQYHRLSLYLSYTTCTYIAARAHDKTGEECSGSEQVFYHAICFFTILSCALDSSIISVHILQQYWCIHTTGYLSGDFLKGVNVISKFTLKWQFNMKFRVCIYTASQHYRFLSQIIKGEGIAAKGVKFLLSSYIPGKTLHNVYQFS